MLVHRHGLLIHVDLIAVILFQFGNVARGVFGAAFAVLGNDVDQRAFDVFRHAQSVAAHIYVRATLKPGPKIAAVIAHAMLDVDFLVAVARPGKRQTGEVARLAHGLELILVEEIVVAALMAEIQPVRPGAWVARRSCRNARNGATPVPGPIMMIGLFGSAGSAKCCAFCT